jgi:AGZA family xanthine/uracil permease-like MFS transporter
MTGALLSAFGIIHAYELGPGGITSHFGFMAAPEFSIAYLLVAALFWVVALLARNRRDDGIS